MGPRARDAGIQQPWGCAVRKKVLLLSLVVICATALALGLTATASAEDELPVEEWQIRTIPTPVTNAVPSFISGDNGKIAWTGAVPGGYSNMYIYDLASSNNKLIPASLAGSYYNPCADGVWVVYQGGRAGGYDDIYLYDTGNGVVQQITRNTDPGDHNDWNPRLDTGRIVWEKDVTGTVAKAGIYLYDIEKQSASLIIEGNSYRNPDIGGDYVVCVKNVATTNGTEIVLYNLKTKELKSIAASTKSNEHPRVDSGMVIWSQGDIWTASVPDTSMTYQIQLYDIAAGTTTALTNNVAGNVNPSIKGQETAWETTNPSGIVSFNYVTSMKGQFSSPGGDTSKSPEVDDGGVIWYGAKGLYRAVPESAATPFPDVPADYVYATAINYIANNGIIQGYTNGSFGPNDLVTRQQFAKMILLTMAVNNPEQYTVTEDDEYKFTDSKSIDDEEGELYPFHYVSKAFLTGLTQGYPDGSFRPLNNISCQQVVTMIVRAGSQVLEPPPSTYKGVLSYANGTHGQNIRLAEYNGLLNGIVGPKGTLASWVTTGNATRGEVAQMLYNLLGKFGETE